MLATGGSAVDAVNLIKQKGGKNIKFMAIIAAPEGIKKFTEAHPDVQLYVAQQDRCLNENADICPGLGDAGGQGSSVLSKATAQDVGAGVIYKDVYVIVFYLVIYIICFVKRKETS